MIASRYFFLFSIAFLSIFSSYGQSDYLLDGFKAYRDNDRIILNWTFKQGSSCIGIGIYRSDDNINYEKIHDIFGECGNTPKPVPYTYIDENPLLNKTNYYILELGFSGRTEPIKIEFIDFKNNGFQLKPNPVTSESILFFQNKQRTDYKLTLYNSQGIPVAYQNDNKDYFVINNVILSPGVYYFRITEDSGKSAIIGKFVSLK